MIRKTAWTSLMILALTAVGCKPVVLNYEETFEVPPQVGHQVDIDPVSRDQKIKVVMNSTGGPVNVYVYLTKDAEDARKIIRTRKIAAPVLAHKMQTENASLEADIPANSAAVISFELSSSKKATVTARITN